MSEYNYKKILIVEDDMFVRKLYRDQFLKEGFLFIEATNGIEGLDRALSEKPDLILLDLMLPRKSGFDVLRDLKKNDETKNIPVIILSNLGQESDVDEVLSLGATDYFIKSGVRLSEVVNRVKAIIHVQ